MAFRGFGSSDSRGKSTSTRFHPPPIITTGPNHSIASSSRSSTLSIASSTSSTSTSTSTLSPHHLTLPQPSPPVPISPLSSTTLPLLHSGLLKKKSPSGFSYHTRYFTLSPHFLSYFNKATDRFPLGYLTLSEIVTVTSGGGTIELGLRVAGGDKDRKYKLMAENREEADVWRQKIEKAITSLLHQPHTPTAYDDLSPRTPMALKRPTGDGGWKEEPSELERSFFALKFSGKRGGLLCRTLIDVRTNLDVLRFLIELLVDAPELRGEGVLTVGVAGHERRHSATASFPVPSAISAVVSSTTSLHARAASVGMDLKVAEDFNRSHPNPHSVSDPTSPRAPVPSDDGDSTESSHSLSVIAVTPLADKVTAEDEKPVCYAHLVSSLSFDDKHFILSWLSTPSTLSSLTSLLLIPNALLHDRILRVLYLHCIVTVKAERPRLRRVRWGNRGDDEVTDDVGNRYGLLMKSHMSNVTLPSFQLQLIQSLLLMCTTPLALFPTPHPPSTSFHSTFLHHTPLLRTIFASLFHSDLHLRKKVLKDLTALFTPPPHSSHLSREREATRWLLLLLSDVPLRAKRKNGLIRSFHHHVMVLLTRIHTVAFRGGERVVEEQKKDGGGADVRDVPPVPLFPELIARALLLSAVSSPPQSHSTARAILVYLITDLLHHPQWFHLPLPPSSRPPNPQIDSLCYHNLLHLLALIKTFIFLPDRFNEMVTRARAGTQGGSRGRASSGGPGDNTSYITDLIPSSMLTSTLQYDNDDPPLLDLPSLLTVPLIPLSTEASSDTPAVLTSPISASVDSDVPSLLSGNPGRFEVHRTEKRGMKGDAELLALVVRLLTALCDEGWGILPSFVVKGGIKVGERLATELSFFQDANVFLLLLTSMVSTTVTPPYPSDISPTEATIGLPPSLLTPIESSALIFQFLSAKPGGRRKVFRRYELRYRDREEAARAAAESRSKQIELQMQADAEKERRVTKILLLGPAEAGKSTLFKQVKKLYGEGFNTVDRQSHVLIILANLLRAMRALIFHSERLLMRFPFSALDNLTGASSTTIDPSLGSHVAFINTFDLLQHFPSLQVNSAEKLIPQVVPPSLTSVMNGETFGSLFAQCLEHLSALWVDLGVQLTYENRAKFDAHQLYDGDGFFLSRLAELRDSRWLPTEEDIIRTRIRSLGVHQCQWEDASGQRYRLTDVAGQRSERTKWMGFFNDTTCVIFVAAVSEYDQVLNEDPSVNRLHESLQAFQQLTTIHWFEPIPLILLLNKADLYREKIQRVSLKLCFPKYRPSKGNDEVEEGLEYIKAEFLKRVRSVGNGGTERAVFIHVISAVEADAARVCFQQVNQIVKDRIHNKSLTQAQMQ